MGSSNPIHPCAYRSPLSNSREGGEVDTAVPEVGFAPPFLGLCAAELKTLDMRLADDPRTRYLRIGDLFEGVERHNRVTSRQHFRVVHIQPFSSPAAAYAHYQLEGSASRIFPPEWCSLDGVPVTSPAAAEAFYAGLFQRPREAWERDRRVNIFTIRLEAPYMASLPEYMRARAQVPQLPRRLIHAVPRPPTVPRALKQQGVTAAIPPPARMPASKTKKSTARLPPYAPLTPAAQEECSRLLAAATPAADIEKYIAEARRRARARGSSTATAEDLRAALGRGSARPSPADVRPQHYEELMQSLDRIARRTRDLSRGGTLPPRVLVLGEKSAVVARMFRHAGAEVATCDLETTEDPSIPHYQGDAADIQDAGWDFVIAHSPCTYLANSGVQWLHRDPHRWSHVVENAAVFRRMQHANAPFVASENSKMHRAARDLVNSNPTQYVHPWQHGTGHTKPTALHLKNLPPLQPTCVVAGREPAVARLPPSEDRATLRSRTYQGVAGAMALQWMPILLNYVAGSPPMRRAETAAETVKNATSACRGTCQIAFVRDARCGANRDPETISVQKTAGGARELLSIPLEEDETPRHAIDQWLKMELVPSQWARLLHDQLELYPDGHRLFTTHPEEGGGEEVRRVHLWTIEVTHSSPTAVPLSRRADPSHPRPEWHPCSQISAPEHFAPLAADDFARYWRQRCASIDYLPSPSTIAAPVYLEAAVPLAPSRFPWLAEYPELPLPTPRPRQIRRQKGLWRVWTAGTEEKGEAQYRWRLLPLPLRQSIDAHLGYDLHSKSLPAVDEGAEQTLLGDPVRRLIKAQLDLGDAAKQPAKGLPPLAGECHHDRPQEVADRLEKEIHQTWKADQAARRVARADPSLGRWYRSREDRLAGQVADALNGPAPPMGPRFAAVDFEKLWDRRPPPRAHPYLGLGASPSDPDSQAALRHDEVRYLIDSRFHGSRRASASRRSRAIRIYHESINTSWVEPGHPEVATRPTASPTLRVAAARRPAPEAISDEKRDHRLHLALMLARKRLEPPRAEQLYQEWTQQTSTSSPCSDETGATVAAIEPKAYDESDLTEAPAPYRLDLAVKHSLFVKALRFLVKRRGKFYADVNCAVAINRVLADTGAGPSIITTEFLAQLPNSVVLGRSQESYATPIHGADGAPLAQHGTAILSFLLGDTPCKHNFTVVEGAPLLLLGTDFLDPRSATIAMNVDGEGSGRLTLTSSTKRGLVTHTAETTTVPVAAAAVVASALGPTRASDVTGASTSAEETSGADTARVEELPKPDHPNSSAAEYATDAVEPFWELAQSEHLLYSSHIPITLPPRSKVTVSIRAPKALVDQSPSCLVDRLPQRAGLEQPPHVVSRCTSIVNGRIEVTILNTGRRRETIAAHTPLALLDSEYYVRGAIDPDAIDAADTDYVRRLSPEERVVLDAVTIDPDGRLDPEQLERARQLVAKHISAFALDPKNPSKTHLLEVELPLRPGAVPHRHAPSRVGEEGNAIIEKHVAEMESRGIIRKSNSAWGSRVVLVGKKDGSIRFCIDYRDLNSKLLVQDSPLPLTVEAIDRLGSGKGDPSSLFLSTLDLASGFWCLPIEESSKPLTAFVTRRQKYEFNYLPFGIQSGPSYMCRLMDAALQGLAWETCMPYLDDVGIWSTGTGATAAEKEADSFEQMMTRLDQVFERLKWAGLSMKASKCELFATKACYLGHIMSREGLRMDPAKISAVSEIDTTTINTLTKVRSFLGLCSYYRRFISGFSKMAAPLTDLTQEGVDVETQSQTPACQDAMRKLITSITTEPVLASPRFDRPFIVSTDAANTEGIGGVLGQLDDDGRERVVAYYSRRLTSAERKYTVTEIELLAALESIRNWRPYLWGRQFKLVVDHHALRWLHTMRDTVEGGPASRLMRWILKLSEYDFMVEHKPGAIHKNADGVSRLVSPVLVTPVVRKPVTTARSLQAEARPEMDPADIRRAYLNSGAPSSALLRSEQQDDAECEQLRYYLAHGHAAMPPAIASIDLRRAARLAHEVAPREGRNNPTFQRRVALEDGILYRRLGDDHWVPWVPESLRHQLLTAFHDRMGHQSRDRTYAALAARYYWPGMQRNAHNHVNQCHECTLAKPGHRPRQPKGPTVGQYPFDVLYADIVDMVDSHDYDAESGAGCRKLIVFVDSLTRWVEAIPVHRDPTSEQVLDLFNEYVLSRHGAPRRIITDSGSNLASRLCDAIFEDSGTDLRPGAAEHHEAVGLVERFNQTLVGMARASDEGGRYWREHLPFLLLAHRATPNQTTKVSPAMLLYGRELRLPAQLSDDTPPQADTVADDESDAVVQYARRLHARILYAWQAANQAIREVQSETVSETVRKTLHAPYKFNVGDRVVRRLYDSANKLQYLYAGPYRVEQVLGDGRYRLTDLENNHVRKDMDVSNLRPYRVHLEEEALQTDEYLVDSIMKHRGQGATRDFLVKWRGYPRSQGTWVPRSELERRCAELIVQYERASDAPRPRPQRLRRAGAPAPPPPPVQPAAPPPTAPVVDGYLPVAAKFERGQWLYNRVESTPRGPRSRWLPFRNFTPIELDSLHFRDLRAQVNTGGTVAAVVPVELPDVTRSAKVWFYAPSVKHGGARVLCFRRADGGSLDTFGGKMEAADLNQYNRTALREIREGVKLPALWLEDCYTELASYPSGQRKVTLTHPRTPEVHRVAVWGVVPVAASNAMPTLRKEMIPKIKPGSLKWRPVQRVVAELTDELLPMGAALRAICLESQAE